MILTALLSLLISSPAAFALDPQNPSTFCDRFLGELEKTNCEKRVKTLGPDWYLAKVCEKQFDDENFWGCLELSQRFNFNPKTLGPCEDTGMTDTQRLLCVEEKALRKNASIMEAYQRMPASSEKPTQKKRNLTKPH